MIHKAFNKNQLAIIYFEGRDGDTLDPITAGKKLADLVQRGKLSPVRLGISVEEIYTEQMEEIQKSINGGGL